MKVISIEISKLKFFLEMLVMERPGESFAMVILPLSECPISRFPEKPKVL